MKRFIAVIFTVTMILVIAACSFSGGAERAETQKSDGGIAAEDGDNNMDKTLKLFIGDTEVAVEWADNEAVKALKKLVSENALTVRMSPYGGFEQVGSLGTSLPRADKQTTTEAGDVVLYSGNQIVIFYGSNTWSYTRLGKITGKTAEELTVLLGGSAVTVKISY